MILSQHPDELYYAKEAIQIGGYCPMYWVRHSEVPKYVRQYEWILAQTICGFKKNSIHWGGIHHLFYDWKMIDCSLIAGSQLLPHGNKQQLERKGTVSTLSMKIGYKQTQLTLLA